LLSYTFCISFIGAIIETRLSESSTAVSRGLNAANTTKKEIIIMTNYKQTEAIYKNANYSWRTINFIEKCRLFIFSID
jgi:hypothetical protein